ncbi:MAG: GIY-YIG nuclease family protein [Candidatus Kerfeldbacteria bacterium]|nr:GIY-YIG nuclease family protein [Candidatus Kerfeldbacteria bacterium]
MYYVYVLKSIRNGKLYTGFTNNLEKRLRLHREGKVHSTKWRLPVELLYYEAYLAEDDAREREKYLKTGWGRNYIQKFLKKSLALKSEGKV